MAYEPVIIGFCCNWCAYSGADAAGTARIQYAPNVHIIRTMCTGMIHPNLVMDALTWGADGVLICGCHPGDCHYGTGNEKAEKRAEAIRLMLDDFGIEQERFRLEWISASESKRFAQVVNEMTEELKPLEPQIIKMKKKIEAGARFFQTQAVYEPQKFKEFIGLVKDFDVPVIAGIVVLKSASMANFMNESIAGINIPEEIINELGETAKADRKKKAVEITARIIRQIKPFCQGVHIMAMGWEEIAPDIIREANLDT